MKVSEFACSEWPLTSDGVPYCCLKRGDEHGFIFGDSWDVHLGYIWDGGDGRIEEYLSAAKVTLAGWEVD